MTRLCDYEGSTYRTEFWEGRGREYEDLAERLAMRQLLPPTGERIIEVGAGFGRLASLYRGYRQVVIMDYARTQLAEAQRQLGQDARYVFVVANVYDLPFVDNAFDALTMVRVMHHLADVPVALAELERVICARGSAVIEFANKHHAKAILRWLLGQQRANPFDPVPDEFIEMNFNFHPSWMWHQFARAGFKIERVRTVSHLRAPWLKRRVPAPVLARIDGWLQPTGRWWQLAPSIFLRAQPRKTGSPLATAPGSLFRCPVCHSPELSTAPDKLVCRSCYRQWDMRDGIYDFKTPL
jgi:ubiquinone/menaquinone biosynthesis C-methylase UbiE